MKDLVGTTLGSYAILAEIAQGGMSTVYRARQASVGRDVAIKVLPGSLMHEKKFLERFNREVEVIASLQHPHILPVYDFGEQDGIPYIVMAYLTGGTLSEYIVKHGPLPLNEVIKFMRQIADALEFAHSKGIIHRDFKPSNVLLDEQGNAYLSDFGVARIMASTANLTGESAMLGTPHYMAPEQVSGGELTAAIDVYALGATLYEMLTGRVPYDGPTPIAVIMAHTTQPIPQIGKLRTDLPDDMQTIIDHSLSKSVKERYPTPTALNNAFLATMEGKAVEPVFAEVQGALAMTNMLGQVIFVDQQCLQLLKRPLQDARTIVGKPLAEILGIPADTASQLLTNVSTKARVDGLPLEIHDAHGSTIAVTCMAIATYDSQKAFVGMDLTLIPTSSQLEVIEITLVSSGQLQIDTQEATYLQIYFKTQIAGLQELLMNLGGRKLRDHLDTLLNETAQRNVWPVTVTNDGVRIELNSKDADIYRALLAKAVNYATAVIGEKLVTRQLDSVEKKLEPRISTFAREKGLR